MPPIEPPDSHYFSAALGWLGLGNAAEAEAELAHLSSGLRQHPDVLEVSWLIQAQQQRWTEALRVARLLLQAAPKRASGWLDQAYALRRVPEGGLQKAWEALFPAFEKFPQEPTIPYNLSCYACQMHQLESARLWLHRAFSAGNKTALKQQALADLDLQPLWEEIKQL